MPSFSSGTVAARMAIRYRGGDLSPILPRIRARMDATLAGGAVGGRARMVCDLAPNPFIQLRRNNRWFTADDWHLLLFAFLSIERETTDEAIRGAISTALVEAGIPSGFIVSEFHVASMTPSEAQRVPPPALLTSSGVPSGYASFSQTPGPGYPGFIAPAACAARSGNPWSESIPAGTGHMPTSRIGEALTGTAFAAALQGLSENARENAILSAAMRGQIPSFLKNLVPITVSRGGHTATYRVMPDVLAIGTDEDYLRVPLKPGTAQKIANAWGMLLPTPLVVDDISTSATIKVVPRPMSPQQGEARASTRLYIASNQSIQGQKGARTGLVSGAKKHVVISPSLSSHPGRVLIYGWYYPTLAQAQVALGSGRRVAYVQPHSWVHAASYVDYSHGIQLIDGTMTVDGQQTPTEAVLKSRELSPLLSNQGPLRAVRYPV